MRHFFAGLALASLAAGAGEARAASYFDHAVSGIWGGGPGNDIRMQNSLNVFVYAASLPGYAWFDDQIIDDFAKSGGTPTNHTDVRSSGSTYVGSDGTETFTDSEGTTHVLTSGKASDGWSFDLESSLDYGSPTVSDTWTVTWTGDGSTGTPGSPLEMDGGPVIAIDYQSFASLQTVAYDVMQAPGAVLAYMDFSSVTSIIDPAFTYTSLELEVKENGTTLFSGSSGFPTSIALLNGKSYNFTWSFYTRLGAELDPPFFVQVGGTIRAPGQLDPTGPEVPEPATLALLGAGAACLVARRRLA